MDIYKECPQLADETYLLRLVQDADCADLLDVYSDTKAVLLFNSDNCGGDDFHYTTMARMQQAIDFWRSEYALRYYVRFAVVDLHIGGAVGTIELFNRQATDYFHDCGLLRLDLCSDYEAEAEITHILSLILPPAGEWFGCSWFATKVIPAAKNRIAALTKFGFVPSDQVLVGHDGTRYGDYWVLRT